MPIIKPFKAIRYDKKKIVNDSTVVAPPYDVISPKMQNALYRLSPHNVVRLILGKIEKTDNAKNNRYIRAGELFRKWLNRGILKRDAREAIYVYSQKYRKSGRSKDMIGFIALMKIGEDCGKKVLPHENTLAAPKTDRLNLMREVKANLSPIFIMYEDARHRITGLLKRAAAKSKPEIDVNIDAVRHRLWKVDDKTTIGVIQKLMKKKDTFIADGHHRFEVAKMYGSEYIMVYFVEADERMLTVLPAHRVVKDAGSLNPAEIILRLKRYFEVRPSPGLEATMKKLADGIASHAFGVRTKDKRFYILTLKDVDALDRAISDKPKDWRRLDVSILHLFILQHVLGIRDDDDNIEFVKEPSEAALLLNNDSYNLVFFLNPTRVSEVKKIARLGEKMPRKATYFYPKPLSGLVINKLEPHD